MDIALYIANLLNQHNEVNIPGLGTFFRKRASSVYNNTTHLFTPPTHQLAFKLEQGQSLKLANYCCEQRNISQKTAIYFIEKFVKTIWEQLNATGHADVSPIGTLKKTDEGYVLDTTASAVKNNAYYGLKSIPTHASDHITPSAPAPIVPIVVTPPIAAITPQPKPESTINQPTRKPIIETILAFISLALFAITIGYYFYPDTVNNILSSDLFKPKDTTSRLATTVDLPVDTAQLAREIDQLAAEIDALTTDTSKINKDVAATTTSYEIIGASFAKEAEAEKYIADLNAKGISAKIAHNVHGARSKVSYGSFTDKDAAETELRRIRKDLNPDAWIATVTPNKQ